MVKSYKGQFLDVDPDKEVCEIVGRRHYIQRDNVLYRYILVIGRQIPHHWTIYITSQATSEEVEKISEVVEARYRLGEYYEKHGKIDPKDPEVIPLLKTLGLRVDPEDLLKGVKDV